MAKIDGTTHDVRMISPIPKQSVTIEMPHSDDIRQVDISAIQNTEIHLGTIEGDEALELMKALGYITIKFYQFNLSNRWLYNYMSKKRSTGS